MAVRIVASTSDLGSYTELETGLLGWDWPSVRLRAEVRGFALHFAVSKDGLDWHDVGDGLDLAVTSHDHGVMRFTGTMIALLAIDSGPATMWAPHSGIRVGA